jgi:hypothetical protein
MVAPDLKLSRFSFSVYFWDEGVGSANPMGAAGIGSLDLEMILPVITSTMILWNFWSLPAILKKYTHLSFLISKLKSLTLPGYFLKAMARAVFIGTRLAGGAELSSPKAGIHAIFSENNKRINKFFFIS